MAVLLVDVQLLCVILWVVEVYGVFVIRME